MDLLHEWALQKGHLFCWKLMRKYYRAHCKIQSNFTSSYTWEWEVMSELNSIQWNFFWLCEKIYATIFLVLICLLKGAWWLRSCASFPAVNKTADWWCLTCQEVLFALHLRYVQTVLPQVGLSLSVIFYYWAWVIDRNRGFGLWNFGQPVF